MNRFYAIVVFIFLLFRFQAAEGQCGTPGNYCMDGTTYTSCSGTLFDNGGGGSYSGDETQITICPDEPGQVTRLLFEAFYLQTNFNPDNTDYLFIYDGASSNAPLIGQFSANELQGGSISGSVSNATGCLTLVLVDNGPANTGDTPFPGFQASISCTNPCAYPTSFITSVAPSQVQQGESMNGCVGEPVAFSAVGSTAQPGFVLTSYLWNFGDNNSETSSGQQIQHTFDEPGLYYVSVAAVDNNGCASLDNLPIQVMVSTIPEFSDIASIEPSYCLGTQVTLNAGSVIFPTWTTAPPTVVAETLPLPDGAGFAFESELTFDFFSEGEIIDDCSDLLSVQTTIEHSFIGDLSISIECPNGTSVNIVPYPNGNGGAYFGEPVDDENQPTALGVPYTYHWVTNGTAPELNNSSDFGVSLPAGSYQSEESLCDLIGCPLNGTWTLTVVDNLLADNGWLTEWTLLFDPSFYPTPIEFTPTYGGGADSSYWSGPHIVATDAGADIIELELNDPGSYTYTYTTSNNFGCISDTSITIVIEEPPVLFAGGDLDYSCQPIPLNAVFQNQAMPECGNDAGTFTLCYGSDDYIVETYCPDDPGDGVTMMQISILSGTIEYPFDDLIIYDGNSPAGTVLWESSQDNIGGATITATNPTGCLTMVLDADFSISCEDGDETPINYTVQCTDGSNYVWSWTPADGLSNASVSDPVINTLSETTTYTVTAHPAAHPECAISDDITISVDLELVVDGQTVFFDCVDHQAVIAAPQVLQGAAPYQYLWTLPDGSTSAEPNIIVTTSSAPQTLCVDVSDACNLSTTFCVELFSYPSIPATFSISDALGCPPHFVNMTSDYTLYQNIAAMEWTFGDGGTAQLMGSSNHAFNSAGSFYPILTITDMNGCITADTLNTPIIVVPNPVSSFEIDPGVAYLPQTAIRFRDYSQNAASYEYTFDEYGTGYSPDTSFTFPEVRGEYFIRLVTFNEIGCTDTLIKTLLIKENIDIFIPNSFTPDGDGINDVWKVEGSGFVDQNFELVIFNRWGEPVFRATDPNQAWLGDHQGNGYYNQDSIYFYLLKVQDVENDVRYEYQGHILLVR